MLPDGTALTGSLAHRGVIGTDVPSVVGRQPTGSALPGIESSGLVGFTGVFQPPARCPLIRPLTVNPEYCISPLL